MRLGTLCVITFHVFVSLGRFFLSLIWRACWSALSVVLVDFFLPCLASIARCRPTHFVHGRRLTIRDQLTKSSRLLGRRRKKNALSTVLGIFCGHIYPVNPKALDVLELRHFLRGCLCRMRIRQLHYSKVRWIRPVQWRRQPQTSIHLSLDSGRRLSNSKVARGIHPRS
jgi:hypothetical protein